MCVCNSPGPMPRISITTKDAEWAAKILHVNTDVVTISMLKQGMEVELEHGFVNAQKDSSSTAAKKADAITNVTNDDLLATAKIALAHYAEGLNYYRYLEDVEKKLEDERGDLPFVDVFLHPVSFEKVSDQLAYLKDPFNSCWTALPVATMWKCSHGVYAINQARARTLTKVGEEMCAGKEFIFTEKCGDAPCIWHVESGVENV